MIETLAERLRELEEAGYTQALTAIDGELCNDAGTLRFDPESLEVCEQIIFEGSSDPADATILFALHEPKTQTRGTWIVRRGAAASSEEQEVATRLLHGNKHTSGPPAGGW